MSATGWSIATPSRRRPSYWIIAVAGLTLVLGWGGYHAADANASIARLIGGARDELLGPAIIGFVVLAIVFERLWPAVRRPLLARGHVHDGLYLLLYATAVIPLVALIDLGFSGFLQKDAPWLVLPRLAVIPRWGVVVVAVLAMDFCNWLAHLMNHRVQSLWRLHAVHHTQEELSILTSFRAHPLVHTSFVISTIPVVVLLANGGTPAVIITGYICLGALPHANLRWSFGPIGRVIVSPRYHRLHHAAEGRIDVNLGTVFTIWDVLTGRARFPDADRSDVVATGLAGRPIPVEQAGPRAHHVQRLAVQLIEPFAVIDVPRRSSDGAVPLEAISANH